MDKFDGLTKTEKEAIKYQNYPDESRLEEFFGLHHAELDGIMMSILKQVASIKDAECKDRIKRIFKEIEENDTGADFINSTDAPLQEIHSFPDGFLQALKKKEGVK